MIFYIIFIVFSTTICFQIIYLNIENKKRNIKNDDLINLRVQWQNRLSPLHYIPLQIA